MNIFFDARWTRTVRHDGVSRYGANLAESLAKLHPITLIIHNKAQLKLLPKNIPYIILNDPLSPKELFIGRKLNKLGADVVFSPLQYMGWIGRQYKLIFTLHDLIYYRHPKPPLFLPWYVRTVWRLFHTSYWPQRLILNKADHIVTVSETSKRYMQKHHLTDRKIGVVYNAPGTIFKRKRPEAPTKDLVYMGSFMPYKNVEYLLRNMERLPDYTLHLLSRITPKRKIELMSAAPRGAKLKFWNGISDEDYSQLLNHAHALVSASKDEGFGLPLVEAMAEGVPIICSDIEIFHEVAGEAGLYFNSNDPGAFAKCVRKLEDKKVRQKLSQKAPQQAAKFNWDSSAKALFEIIKELTPKK